MINESTEEATSLHVTDASILPAVLSVRGNHYQETQEGTDNLAVLNEGTITQDGITIDIKDGVATVSGTNTSDAATYITIGTAYLYANNTYYFRKEKGSMGGEYSLFKDGKTIWFPDSGENSSIIPKTGEWTIRYSVGANVSPSGIFKIGIYKTSGAEWVQGKKAIPSLEYPSRIKTIGDNINLLPNNATNKSENGVDFTVNSDKSIHVVGTATDNVSISLVGQYYDTQEVFRFKKNKQYKNVSNVDILYRKVSGDYVRIQKNTVFSYAEDVPVRYMYIQVDKGTTVDETYYPKIIEYYEGVDESYSPYNLGSLKIIKSNKNLFKLNDSNLNGVELTNLEDGSYKLNGTSLNSWVYQQGEPFIIGEGIYNISTEGLEGVASAVFGIRTKDNSFKQEISVATTSRSFEIEKNMKVIPFFTCSSGTVYDNVIAKVQLEKSKVKTEWAKHEEKEYNLSVQQEMLDKDYFDLENNKEIHKWKKVILNGTENWQQSTVSNSVFFLNFADITTDTNKFKLLSNQYEYLENVDYAGKMKNNKIYGFIVSGNLLKRIILRNDNFTTLDSFKASLAEKNMTLYYVASTTTELDLTEEQKQVLNELNNLELFKGTNNIYTEQDLALLQLDYTADTKMYIDNKIANTNAQVLNM